MGLLTTHVRPLLPLSVRILGRSYPRAAALDALDAMRGRSRPRLVPPRRLNIAGPGDFLAVGAGWVETMRLHAGLAPESHVLDVGCGIGRVAAALTGYLSPQANYRGFDVIKFAVEWCQREIGGQFPNFEFRHVDVFNESYNPTGAVTGAQFSFPYAAGQFDFALATSLYTHLLPDAAERYLAESARVLRPGGTLFSTWYLAGGGDAPAPIMARFPVDRGHYRLQSAEHPASAVSYAEPWVREVFGRHQFAVERVVTGKWRGGDGRHNQDFIVARRR